jgi:hypothetical protein
MTKRMLNLIVENTVGPSVKKSIKGLYIHSFICIFSLRNIMTPNSLKIATYNVHGWFDGEGKHNLERVLQLYRKHSSQLSLSLSLQFGSTDYILHSTSFQAVLRIHDILGRIWFRGSTPLTNGSGSGSCYFRH